MKAIFRNNIGFTKYIWFQPQHPWYLFVGGVEILMGEMYLHRGWIIPCKQLFLKF